MALFEFSGVGRIVFGRGKFAAAGELAATLGKSALVIFNGAANEEPARSIGKSEVAVHPLRQRGEPVVSQVNAAVQFARDNQCDCVIGIGGGSAIDSAKAVAGLLTNGGSAVDYMEVVGKGKKISKPAAPWMAVPTTAGTGAEATRNAVIGLPERKFKASIRSELLLPRIAIIDPKLTFDLPPSITASAGLDALCQLIESYTSTGASPMTDALALTGIPLAAKNLATAFRDGKDLEAREAMSLAALIGGMTLTNAGLGAVHGFAAPLGANFPAPHGVICAALLPHIVKANIQALKLKNSPRAAIGLAKYGLIGKTLGPGGDPLETCIQFTSELTQILEIPPLKDFEMNESHVPEMVALARKASSMRFNPVELSDESLGAALLEAIDGAAA